MNTHLEIETMFDEFDNNDYPEIYEIKVENNDCILQHSFAKTESDAIKIAEKLIAAWDGGVKIAVTRQDARRGEIVIVSKLCNETELYSDDDREYVEA